jgi:hypothetical protein
MGTLNASFKNNTDASHYWNVVDSGIDPNVPKVVFQDYLDPGAATDWIALYTDGSYAKVLYQRAGGPQQVVDDVTNNSVVSME